ncbi:Aste57867_3808 [Aphanomyces stellatus]|uniref:Aste57867_3808 protein n=1 Tax=Aphanomyces stellatus TaxID=120398 RepID=A0A485KC19_9STRA|nr:hypothetical protein As57867_003797 [Aphanomyces stellatus]VFT80957.1 Aste57867_3808 [Aphanomyces stellatus]
MGHFYAVQESAWMDERVWTYYLESLLKPQVREPSVLLVDNFDSHVSAKGHKTAEQPLDVGVMAPFKRHLRDLWLQEDLIEGEDGDEEHDVDLMSVSARQKRVAMIARAIKAWSRITLQEIRRSFAKALPR